MGSPHKIPWMVVLLLLMMSFADIVNLTEMKKEIKECFLVNVGLHQTVQAFCVFLQVSVVEPVYDTYLIIITDFVLGYFTRK